MRTSILCVAFATSCLCSAPSAAADPAPKYALGQIQESHLANGMTVVIQEDHRVPFVSLQIQYPGGAAAAPVGMEAAAPLTTSLMLLRTKHVPRGGYARLLSRAGATDVTDRTTADNTTLSVTLPANRLALPLWLWSDQIAFFDETLEDADVVAKRDALRDDRRATIFGSPLSVLSELGFEEVFPADHPYRRSFLTPDAADHVDRAAVVAFHDRWITPGHAFIVIIGDVVAADALALVTRYFEGIPGGTGAGLTQPSPYQLAGEAQIDVAANVPHAKVSIRWPTARLLTTDDAKLDIVQHLLKGERTARLFWKLVDDMKVATGVGAHQTSKGRGSWFEVNIDAAPGKSAAEVLAAFDTALDDFQSHLPSQRDINHAEYEIVTSRAMDYEDMSERSREMVTYEGLVGDPSYILHDLRRYDGITPAMVHATVDKFLPRDRRVVFLVTPTPTAPPAGKKTGRRFVPARTP